MTIIPASGQPHRLNDVLSAQLRSLEMSPGEVETRPRDAGQLETRFGRLQRPEKEIARLYFG